MQCTLVTLRGEAARQVCHPTTMFLLHQFRTVSTVSAAFCSPAFLQVIKCKEYCGIFSVRRTHYTTVTQESVILTQAKTIQLTIPNIIIQIINNDKITRSA